MSSAQARRYQRFVLIHRGFPEAAPVVPNRAFPSPATFVVDALGTRFRSWMFDVPRDPAAPWRDHRLTVMTLDSLIAMLRVVGAVGIDRSRRMTVELLE